MSYYGLPKKFVQVVRDIVTYLGQPGVSCGLSVGEMYQEVVGMGGGGDLTPAKSARNSSILFNSDIYCGFDMAVL